MLSIYGAIDRQRFMANGATAEEADEIMAAETPEEFMAAMTRAVARETKDFEARK